ncbi:MAG: hypothetical protein ACRD4B_01045 [Acidobacteriota bacterium]
MAKKKKAPVRKRTAPKSNKKDAAYKEVRTDRIEKRQLGRKD